MRAHTGRLTRLRALAAVFAGAALAGALPAAGLAQERGLCRGEGGAAPRSSSTHEQMHGSQNILSGSRDGERTWVVSWTGGGCSLDVRARGDVKFTREVTDVESISPGGYF